MEKRTLQVDLRFYKLVNVHILEVLIFQNKEDWVLTEVNKIDFPSGLKKVEE